MRGTPAAALLVLCAVLFGGCMGDGDVKETRGRVLRHVVLFKFRDSASPADIERVVDSFRALQDKIDVIRDFEWGTDVSPENLQQGFTHCFLLSFDSEEDRDAYLPHPAHREFGTVLRPHLDKVLVVDYWAVD